MYLLSVIATAPTDLRHTPRAAEDEGRQNVTTGFTVCYAVSPDPVVVCALVIGLELCHDIAKVGSISSRDLLAATK